MTRISAGAVCHLRLSGTIDETFNAQDVSAGVVGHVILDLGQVERISSFGVRKWVEFTSKLPNGTVALYLVHAPPVMVDQLNMVEGFGGIARALSVLAPYSCQTCGEDRLRLVDAIQDAEAISKGEAPAHSCPVCRQPLEFADQAAEFFDYLRHQKLGAVDPTVLRYLRMLQPNSEGGASTHLKIVQEDITFISVASSIGADLNVRKLASGLEGRVVYDFASVVKVAPEAQKKLTQVLETAAEAAQVFLVRLTAPVLGLLAQNGKPPPAKIASLLLRCQCTSCGSERGQRIGAKEYLAALQGGPAISGLPCPVCGGTAVAPVVKEALTVLQGADLSTPAGEFDALEQRALSQYITGQSSPDFTPTKPGEGAITSAMGGGNANLQVLRRLGQGGMAEVFLARQQGVKGFEKYVVVKKVLAQFAESPDFVEMLFAEARANARLTHPNIVQTYDVGMMDGAAYLTMEYVRGPDVKKILVGLRKLGVMLPMEHALRIVAETAAGLHYAHSYVDPTGKPHPMVHRDVSPHNILISLDGAVKLSDFGIAKVEGEGEHTRPGTLKGKIAYVAPEAISGMPLDPRADVFSLGVVLYELLTGQLPFRRESEAATLRAIMRDAPTPPSQLNPQVPVDISQLVLRALEKDPGRRTPSAAVMRQEIEAAMAHHRMAASPFAVAQFLKDTLGQWLTDFAPNAANDPSQNSMGSAVGAARTSGSHPATTPMAPVPVAAAASKDASMQQTVVAEMLPAQNQVSARASGGTASVGVAAARVSGPVPAAKPPPPVPGQDTPPTGRPAPLEEVRRPSGGAAPVAGRNGAPAAALSQEAPAPRPSSPVNRPVSVVPSPEPKTRYDRAPMGASDPEPETDAGQLRSPMRRPRRWLLGLVVLALVAGGVALSRRGGSAGLGVLNLEPGENLYVEGVRVDPKALTGSTSSDPVIVATAANGVIRRFGNAPLNAPIDIRSLVDAVPDMHERPDAKFSLHASTLPTGCDVTVDGKALNTTTPIRQDLQAGKEILVTFRCHTGEKGERWVMGLMNQQVKLTDLQLTR